MMFVCPSVLRIRLHFLRKTPLFQLCVQENTQLMEQGKRIGVWKRDLNNYGAFLGYVILGLNPVWTPSVMFVKRCFFAIGWL